MEHTPSAAVHAAIEDLRQVLADDDLTSDPDPGRRSNALGRIWEHLVDKHRRPAPAGSSLILDLFAQVTGGPVVDQSNYQFVRLHRPGASDDDSAWAELYNQLCHQGSVNPISYAALPVLAALVLDKPDCAWPLTIASSIVASPYVTGTDRDTELAAHATTIAALRDATERSLAASAEQCTADCQPPMDLVDRAELLTALAAFEGLEPWGFDLDRLTGYEEDAAEVEVECPSCKHYLVVGLPSDGSITLAAEGCEPCDALIAAPDLSLLNVDDARIHHLACQYDVLVTPLTSLFSTITCPGCDTPYRLSDGIRAWTDTGM
ncbi:MAG: hypothetical protein FWD11_06295 [Micrococcales bacterium]|nr:hypothetical protein [Micrococcales bacterium]